MDLLTRRRFLIASGVAGAGALALGAGGWGLAELLKTSAEPWADPSARKLVLVTLYGGNDGLNTVIPYADSGYYAARPELAYGPEAVLTLNEALGLNPKLRGFKRLWDEKRMSVILGVGYPKPDRSHFRSMDIWQTGSPATAITTGWVGRWLDETNAPPEAAVSFEPVIPPLLVGASRAGACVNVHGLALPPGITPEMVGALGVPDAQETATRKIAATSYADLLRVDRLVRDARKRAVAAPSAADSVDLPATGSGGLGSLAHQLEMVASCIEANVPTRIYSVSLGGFDTHAQERAGHEFLLGLLDGGLTAFVDRLGRTASGRKTTVVVYSEFGRRVRANASDGTDHGTAGPVIVLGHEINPGLHGTQPSLSDLDDGDLKANVDFRDIFGTVVEHVLETDPERCINEHQVRLMPLFQQT